MSKMSKMSLENDQVVAIKQQEVLSYGRLGKEIKITPKSHITINKKGYSKEFFCESVSVLIGIGRDHTAELIMERDAWEALNNGAKVNITTTEKFKNDFFVKKKIKSAAQ